MFRLVRRYSTYREYKYVHESIITCCRQDNVPMLNNLFNKHNININYTSQNGKTALMVAATNNNYDVCQFLLQKGANPFITDSNGYTAFDLAILFKHNDVAHILSPPTKFVPVSYTKYINKEKISTIENKKEKVLAIDNKSSIMDTLKKLFKN